VCEEQIEALVCSRPRFEPQLGVQVDVFCPSPPFQPSSAARLCSK
jgi:hypothetical protein